MTLKKIVCSIVAFFMISSVAIDSIAQKSNSTKTGTASFYHNKFVGRKTATGETFSNTKYTAACNQYPLGTYLKVTNNKNGKVVYVKVNDRIGHPKRVIDLTHRAAKDLNFVNAGLATVTVEPVNAQEGQRKILAQTSGDVINDNTL